jgi:hypothetical protein
MKERFPGWHTREPERISALWETAIFVPDANVLLHCLRHPAKVRNELIRVFTILRESLWIPYQVGLEFHRNRLDVEYGAQDMYQRLTADYDATLKQIVEKLRQLRAHPVIEVERELAAIATFQADFHARMDAAVESHPKEAIQAAMNDLMALLDGRVGEKWPPDRLAAIKKEGEERYAKKVPPGFKDIKKDGDLDKFGDLIIWKDMIAKAKEAQRPIVFISDDVKEDWWWLYRGRKLGPRPELVEEFQSETGGQEFLIYEFAHFLRVAAERHQEIRENVDEIEKSLLDDELAKRRLREALDANDMVIKISELEDERERIVQTLSGSPTIDGDRLTSDRNHLRARLDAINLELGRLSSSDSGETSKHSEGQRAD